jgi:phosphoribosylformylglycinamidine (FGAM) synthase PurS component
MEVEADTGEAARATVERMCRELIANPIIEDFEVLIHTAEDGG